MGSLLLLLFLTQQYTCMDKTLNTEPILSSSLRQAVVKVRAYTQAPDLKQPWRQEDLEESHGSGVLIGKNRILTNAHVVAYARFVSVQEEGNDQPYPARVLFVAHDADLALLQVEDAQAFTNVTPAVIGNVPLLHSKVYVVGYPIGGDQVSVTEGVVSRLEYTEYVHPYNRKHLLMQVDAAINFGNSGGPVFQENHLIGIAAALWPEASRIGYVIPTPVVQRFLRDVEDGTYEGHPDLGITTQPFVTNQRAVREFYQLPAEMRGVLLRSVASYSTLWPHLQREDILLSLDGIPVGADGLMKLFQERIDFRAWLDLKQKNDAVALQVWRAGHLVSVNVGMGQNQPHPFVGKTYLQNPPYVCWGGLVFTELSQEYVELWGENWEVRAPLLLRGLAKGSVPYSSKKKQLIVVSKRLPHFLNEKMGFLENQILDQVNGKEVIDLEHLYELLYGNSAERGSLEDKVVMEFAEKIEPVIFQKSSVLKEMDSLKKAYGLSSMVSLPNKEMK